MIVRTLIASMLASTLSVASTAAQLRPADVNGVWKHLGTQVVRPDTTFTQPALNGKAIILNGNFVQLYVQPPVGPQQAGRATRDAAALTTIEQKAARFDRLLTSAGTAEMRDSVVTVHYQYHKSPSSEGSTLRMIIRVRADTMWQIVATPWSRDSTKSVRTTYKFVRQK